MLFSEVYGCYFNAVAEILHEAVEKTLTRRKMTEIVQRKAFSESLMVIPDALKSETWPLLTAEMGTQLHHIPTQPLTIIQKRWMKSLLLDPKIHLFDPDVSGLEEVQPLYDPKQFIYYDRYQDGDPYYDENYIRNFRTVLEALEIKSGLRVKYQGRRGLEHEITGIPKYLEYSSKDDKFRLKIIVADERCDTNKNNVPDLNKCNDNKNNITGLNRCNNNKNNITGLNKCNDMDKLEGDAAEEAKISLKYKVNKIMELNMARMDSCSIEKEMDFAGLDESEIFISEMSISEMKETVVLELTDERNALSRAMLQFSYLEKETRKLDEKHYRMEIHYDRNDETELLVQILSFGPLLYVKEPETFRQKVKQRIEKQMQLFSGFSENKVYYQ